MNGALSFLCFSCPGINVSISDRSFRCRPVMVQRPPSYRISSIVFMNTKRPSRASNQKRKPNPPISSSGDDENTTIAIEVDADAATAQDDALADSEKNFENWSPVDAEDDDVSLEQLLLDEDEEEDETLDDDIILSEGFEEDEEELEIEGAFDEDEEEDEDTEEDNGFDEDDELAAQAESEDFDDEMPIPSVGKRQKRAAAKTRSFPVRTVDDEENGDTAEDVLDPITEGFEPVFGVEDVEGDGSGSKLTAMADESSDEEFDEENAEDIRNAANILSESGILGLGLGEGRTSASSAARDRSSQDDDDLEGDDEDYDFEGLFNVEDEEVSDEEKAEDGGIATVEAGEEQQRQEDQEFALTTESSFGKVWELNEDTYVTITEPGQAYAYELDEEDEEDQEMSTVRRGKQGGWSGGLASYPTSADLPEGSKEWIARRSYELLAQSTPKEMFQWTRRHMSPPQAIADLYPKPNHKPTPLGKQVLQLSSPDSSSALNINKDEENTDPTYAPGAKMKEEKEETESNNGTFDVLANNSPDDMMSEREEVFESDRTALDRSVEFPSSFKFKIESSGKGFRDHIQKIVEDTLRREVEPLSFSVEKEGKLERIEFNVTVQNSKEITDIFDALYSDERVKRSYG